MAHKRNVRAAKQVEQVKDILIRNSAKTSVAGTLDYLIDKQDQISAQDVKF